MAPELTCSWSNKKLGKNSKTFQKILNFFGDEHIHVFYIHAKFRDEMTFLLLCAKKTNPVTKIRFKKYVFRAVILSFLHRAEDMSFHDENLQVCIMHVYVHHQTNSEFFEMFYYFL